MLNTQMKQVGVAAMVASLGLLASCKKNETPQAETPVNEPTAGVAVVDGALHFGSEDDFFATVEMLDNMSESDKDQWDTDMEFKSYRGLVNSIFSDMDDDADLTAIVAENPDIIIEQDDQLEPIIPVASYQNIVNSDGVYYIAGTKHTVTDNEVIVTPAEGASLKSDSETHLPYIKSETTLKSGVTRKLEDNREHDKKRCRAVMRLYIIHASNGVQYYLQDKIEVYSVSEAKNWRGKWKYYSNTTHTMKNVSIYLKVPERAPNNSLYLQSWSKSISYASSGETYRHYKSYYAGARYSIEEYNRMDIYVSGWGYIVTASGEFSTRGIGDRWVLLNMNDAK